MTFTSNRDMDRTSIGGHAGKPIDAQAPAALPPWWLADQETFDKLVKTRLRIYRHEKAAASKARSVAAASVIALISIYSIDAMGAVVIPAAPGFLLLFAALAFPIAIAWLLDYRLVQQLRDIDLRSELWLDLVEAVKRGAVDLAQLEAVPVRETEVELMLRKEARVAAQFLASRNTLVPHLPIFGYCFTLENR